MDSKNTITTTPSTTSSLIKQEPLGVQFRKQLLLQGKAQRTITTYTKSMQEFVDFHNGIFPLKVSVNHINAGML